MKPLEPQDRPHFVAALLDWFGNAMRPLPWRETYDPYRVWISEIMLQQTQMERGVKYFNRWMLRFPTLRSVAEADESAILAAWEGLGYYSRAKNLHAAARCVMSQHGGVFPESIDEIRRLPGVGEYTAGAIASIAFDRPEPAVDANVVRIFARICDIDAPPAGREVRDGISALVRALLPLASPRLLNQAFMEFGALICGKTPRCDACPVAAYCEAKRRGVVADRPRAKEKVAVTFLEMAAAVVVREEHVFIRQRPAGGLWGGLWEFPGGVVEGGSDPAAFAAAQAELAVGQTVEVVENIGVVRHGYTTNRVTLHGFLCRLSTRVGAEGNTLACRQWVRRDGLDAYAFSAGHRKLLERLGWK